MALKHQDPLTDEQWAILVHALAKAPLQARKVLARLLDHHGRDAEGRVVMALDDAQASFLPPIVLLEDLKGEEALNYAAFDPGDKAHWEVTGDRADLMQGIIALDLDANLLRPSPSGQDDEATVAFPSSFFSEPQMFLSLLAVLIRKASPFRLYRVQRRGDDGADMILVRLFPEPGPETREILRRFHPETAARVEVEAKDVRQAFSALLGEDP